MNQQCLYEGAEEYIRYEEERKNAKRNWERNFQKWCDKESEDGTTDRGKCGYGLICDYCTLDQPKNQCILALREYCKERNLEIDYCNQDFSDAFDGDIY